MSEWGMLSRYAISLLRNCSVCSPSLAKALENTSHSDRG